MPTLASALLEAQAITFQQLERALARQMLHGDHLTTHLLELGVEEAALALAELSPAGELPRASQTALQFVSREIAERYRLYPIAIRGGTLEAVVAEPLPKAVLEELRELLGLPLRLGTAPLPRIRQALAREYELPLPERMAELLLRLDEDARVRAPVEKEPEPLPPPAAIEEPQAATKAPSLPPPPQKPRANRRLGPITPAITKEALSEATTRDAVLAAFFDFARQFFEYSALFMVQRAAAEGFDAYGPGAEREAVLDLRLPLDLPGSLAEARARKLPMIATLGSEGADALLRDGISRTPSEGVLLLPLVLRDRVVAILYGDHGEEPVVLSAVGDVLAMAPLVGQALERLIRRRKRGS